MVLQAGWQETGNRVAQLIARAWMEPEFQQSLIADPRAVLEQEGIEVPEGVEVNIDQSANDWSIGSRGGSSSNIVWTIPLPPRPESISEEQLSACTRGELSGLPMEIPACC